MDYWDVIDQFYLKFCNTRRVKSLLDVKQIAPSVMVYGELGSMQLHLKIKTDFEFLV